MTDNERELRDLQKRQDADVKALCAKIDRIYEDLTQQLHDNFVNTMIGVGAMMSVTGAFIVAVLK